MTLVPVSITNDLALPLIPLTMTFHDVITTSVPPVMIKCAPCIEPPVMMLWPPGFALAQNKLTTTVLHKAMPMVLDGHDCGYMLPHITIPPANILLPMHILFSSRKVSFSASKVKANGTPVAWVFPWLPGPMLCCANPVTLPNGFALLNCLNTVAIGVTWLDLVMGWVAVVLTVVADALTRDWKGPLTKPGVMDYVWKLLLGDTPANALKKLAVGAAGGLIKYLATGEGSVQLQVGSPYAGASATYTRNQDGTWSWSVSGSAGIALPVNPIDPTTTVGGGVQGSYQSTHNPDGTVTTTSTSGTTASAGGPLMAGGRQSSSSTTTNYNADGSVKDSQTQSSTVTTGAVPFAGGSKVKTASTSQSGNEAPSTSSGGYQGGSLGGKTWGHSL